MTSADERGRILLERVAGPEDDGVRVDIALRAWLDEPRARSSQRLVAGDVTVDGVAVAKSHRLRAGQRLRVAEPGPVAAPPAPPPAVPVRWEDAHLAVVAKPAGLVVHPGAGVEDATLVDALQAAGMPLAVVADPQRPGIVHRLDRGTSGLLVVAKTADAAVGLTAQLGAREVARTYAAVVDGVPSPPHATIDAPIGRSPRHRTRFAVDPSGRRAVTHYDVVEDFGRAAFLDVRLETGRTHQIRVHLSAVGHPVSGDLTYGASPSLAAELGLERPALHSRRVAFAHPVTGEPIDVTEPLPGDLTEALARLRR